MGTPSPRQQGKAHDEGTPGARSLVRRALYNRSELRLGWRLGLFVGLVAALSEARLLLVRRLLGGADRAATYLVGGVLEVLILILCSWILGRIEGRTLAEFGLPWRKMFRARFWQGALLGSASIACLVALLRLGGAFRFGAPALRGPQIAMWAMAYAGVFLLVAVLEEFGTRGYVLFALSQGIGFWPAAGLSTALFVYLHRANSGENAFGLVNLGLFGILACLLLRRTGDLWMPIGLHLAFDWCETFVLGVANSGERYPGHLLESSPSGPEWLSGGPAGPEGSVIYTLLLLLTLGFFALWLPEPRYPPATGPAP